MNDQHTPNPLQPTNPSQDPVIDCATARNLIHETLDGTSVDPKLLDRHLASCKDCRSLMRQSERLIGCLTLLPRPVLAANHSSRILQAVRRDRQRRRRQRLIGTMALAASVLGFVVWLWKPGDIDRREIVQQAPTPSVEPSIRQQFSEMRSAVVSLTSRAADETVAVLPMPTELDLSIPLTRPDRSPMIETTHTPWFDEAAQGASVAFEPVTSAAGRAFGFLYRELPSLPPERKSDY